MIMYMNRLNENLISLGIMVYDTERYENCRRALASVRIRKISTKLTLNRRSAKRLNLKTVKTGMLPVGAESNSKCKFMQPYRKNASLECRSQFSPVDDG